MFDYQGVDILGPVPTVRELTAVRAEPHEDAERVTETLPGEPLIVTETRNGWARVRTAYDYPGWLVLEALDGEPDPAWLERTADDPLVYARTLLGASYRWGGMSAAGIDCSGLVHMSFRATGRLVPRDADQQEDAGTRVSAGELRAGDLISYGDGGRADHVAFWAGDGRILHATQRDGVDGVVEEEEPPELRARRRATFRL